jgi:hypothetical protein
MALISLTGGTAGVAGQVATLSGGINTILNVMVTSNEATEVLHGATFTGLALTIHGLANSKKAFVQVMYN